MISSNSNEDAQYGPAFDHRLHTHADGDRMDPSMFLPARGRPGQHASMAFTCQVTSKRSTTVQNVSCESLWTSVPAILSRTQA
jgi:hypothetical protein